MALRSTHDSAVNAVQAEGYDKGLEKRVSTLEAALKQLKGGKN